MRYLERKLDNDSAQVCNADKSPSLQKIDDILKNGFIILDKPCGPSSMEVVAHVKTILGLEKAGQSGTLDPETSGILLITTENACKTMPLLQGMEKEYVTVMHVHKEIDDTKLREIVKKFVGTISQIPPVKSAVKRAERKRKVSEIQILDRDGKDIVLRIVCQAGTYIRKIIDDMGKEIGGAHMKELRRIRVGPFLEDESYTLQDLKDSFVNYQEKKDENIREIVLPIEYSLRKAKVIVVKDSAIPNIKNGSPLYSVGVSHISENIKEKDTVALVSCEGFLIAIGVALSDAQEAVNKKVVASKVDRVM
ncbi:RNA-guided pseudouridylation complex pseudouridine synthase subunit Cbf5 [archaeon]|nr:RNA-guided pseudouridylation complex pseudouridine synthase subunit Cbf5 [archaeon]|tara:strand:+ start:310 stop:1233 length:924 start_codon:yes stop_codon:yes gene_type:complete